VTGDRAMERNRSGGALIRLTPVGGFSPHPANLVEPSWRTMKVLGRSRRTGAVVSVVVARRRGEVKEPCPAVGRGARAPCSQRVSLAAMVVSGTRVLWGTVPSDGGGSHGIAVVVRRPGCAAS
jgi:hypothetical protein